MIELNRSRNNVVLSRRAVLEDERKEMRQAILDRLNPGDVVEGTISNIVDFGAFVDLDGMDGLIHISELSWSHVNHPSEVLEIGQTVKVKVLDIDRDRQRISLGLKQTQSDPWQQVLDSYSEGDVVEGRVTKVVTFGAFVEILPGRRGARAHLRARAAPRREPARGRLAGRPGQRADPRGRRRAPPALALAEARRGGRSSPCRAPTAASRCTRRRTCSSPRRSSPTGRGGARARLRRRGRRPRVAERARSGGRGRRRRGRGRGRGRLEDVEAAVEAPAEVEASRSRAVEAPAAEAEAVEEPVAEAGREADRRARGRRDRTGRARGRRDRLSGTMRPIAVAITGGIGAGKSEALRAFARHGAATVSSDEIVHHLLAADDEVRRALVERLGEDDPRRGRAARPRPHRASRLRRPRRARLARGAAAPARRRASTSPGASSWPGCRTRRASA